MSHDECTKNIGSADDLVGHDADTRLQVIVAAAELVKRRDRAIAWTIRVVNRRAVDGPSLFPHRQFLGNRERLAMPDDHPHDVMMWRPPAHDARLDSHPCQADLTLRAR